MNRVFWIAHISLTILLVATSPFAYAADLLPPHGSSNYCPPRFLNSEEAALDKAFVDMGEEPYDPYGFAKLEENASSEIENLNNPNSPTTIVFLLKELNERGMGNSTDRTKRICGYGETEFRSLLWLATKIISKRGEVAPIQPHTLLAVADISVYYFWINGFEQGLYGLPKDRKMAECWTKNYLRAAKECASLYPGLFSELNKSIQKYDYR